MDELELDPIGVGEEDGVIAVTIGGTVGWGVEHRGTDFDEQPMQIVDVAAAVSVPGDVVQAGGVAIMHAQEARPWAFMSPIDEKPPPCVVNSQSKPRTSSRTRR